MRRWMMVMLTAVLGVGVMASTAYAVPDDPAPANSAAYLNGKIVTIVTSGANFTITVGGFCGTSSVTLSSVPAITGLPATVTTSTTGTASLTLPLPTNLVDYVITATANPGTGAAAVCAGSASGTLALSVAQGGPVTTVPSGTTTTIVGSAAVTTTTALVASQGPVVGGAGALPVGGSESSRTLQIASVVVMAGVGLTAVSALRRRRIRTLPTH